MQKRSHYKNITTCALFMVSLFSVCLGLMLCLMKSPTAKSGYYLSLSNQYEQQLKTSSLQPDSIIYLLKHSEEMIRLSIHATPYNGQLWSNFSVALARLNQVDRAMQAHDIAQDLGALSLPSKTVLRTMTLPHNFMLSRAAQNKAVQNDVIQNNILR